MAKLPAIQFYPGDWKKDIGVQSLSFHDRGVWFEILLLMHESEQRGILILNGQAMSEDALSRIIGLDKQNLTTTLTNLLTYGVASRDDATGALMSRRMVRDENLRKVRQESGKLGGNPVLVKQIPTTGDKQIPTPSSSSSTSIPIPKNNKPHFVLPDWIDKPAWDAYEEMRSKLRKSMTNHARDLAVNKLLELRNKGHSSVEVLNQSVMNGWTSLYEVKGGSNGTHQSNQSRGVNRVEQQLEELRKAGVSIPSGRPEAGPEQDVPIAGRGDGFGSSGVVLEGVR